MSKFTVEIHVPGFNEARRDPLIQQNLHQRGQRMADAAGGAPDFVVIDSPSTTRARVVVVTATTAARLAEAEDRVLEKAFEAGRG